MLASMAPSSDSASRSDAEPAAIVLRVSSVLVRATSRRSAASWLVAPIELAAITARCRSGRNAHHVRGLGDGQFLVEHEVQYLSLARRQLRQRGHEPCRRLVADDRIETAMLDGRLRNQSERKRSTDQPASPFLERSP